MAPPKKEGANKLQMHSGARCVRNEKHETPVSVPRPRKLLGPPRRYKQVQKSRLVENLYEVDVQ